MQIFCLQDGDHGQKTAFVYRTVTVGRYFLRPHKMLVFGFFPPSVLAFCMIAQRCIEVLLFLCVSVLAMGMAYLVDAMAAYIVVQAVMCIGMVYYNLFYPNCYPLKWHAYLL